MYIEKSAGQSPFLTSKNPTMSGFPLKFFIVYLFPVAREFCHVDRGFFRHFWIYGMGEGCIFCYNFSTYIHYYYKDRDPMTQFDFESAFKMNEFRG